MAKEEERAAQNTDKAIWRKSDDVFAPSIHVTENGSIGIDVGGYVIVAPVEVWHKAMKDLANDGGG